MCHMVVVHVMTPTEQIYLWLDSIIYAQRERERKGASVHVCDGISTVEKFVIFIPFELTNLKKICVYVFTEH